MTIENFLKSSHYAHDGANFFICTEAWLDSSAGVKQAMDLSLDELLDEWGAEEILEWTVCSDMSIGFLVK